MDRNTFDDFTRAIAGASTRRHFSGMLAALGLGTAATLSLLGADDAEAKKKRKRKRRKKHRKNKGQGGPGPTACTPNCTGKECGPDGCGGACGSCSFPTPVCSSSGTCQIVCGPDCEGPLGPKECGDDGCGGSCGSCPLALPVCNSVTFTCEALI